MRNPKTTKHFFPKNRSRQKFHRFHFSIFFKIPKGGVRRLQAASKLLLGVRNFDPFYFFGGEISKHAACLPKGQIVQSGESPDNEATFFRKIVRAKIFTGLISQYVLYVLIFRPLKIEGVEISDSPIVA